MPDQSAHLSLDTEPSPQTKQVARIDNSWNDPLHEKKRDAKIGGVRSMIGVPLLREGETIGVIALARNRVESFTDHWQTFAASLSPWPGGAFIRYPCLGGRPLRCCSSATGRNKLRVEPWNSWEKPRTPQSNPNQRYVC